mmetsp:Transcript_22629/g.33084  ORF Transcript_22629/g.33084 Transcript_22629/m.33084 type:complete len:346 (-) Transcript_22629:184-1221(-)|eukprot:CAMPEP_0185032154 /NCGR_PEP_ID=MMETSP1103-20130426/20056_1 /TAXON_ID=36769 /ORGANISM="Paraphysomonas bandaiensis, Strain Caron Lab Isolate" /LENGTH=345 /DNA_ID=CAMNT_0027567947 /DNA_START=42 /DNA_END=1079 /DNA_ORIENTATION=-
MAENSEELHIVSDSSNSTTNGRACKRKREENKHTTREKIVTPVEPFPVKSYSGNSIAGIGTGGEKKVNQDCLLMLEDPQSRTLVLACCDGHGSYGHHISRFLTDGLNDCLLKHEKFLSDPQTAIQEVVQDIEFAARCRSDIDTRFSGTTLCIVVIRGNLILVGNVGDSRVVIGVRDTKTAKILPKNLTVDHTPDNPDEFKRICTSGGRIYRVVSGSGVWGPSRVWLSNIDAPGLGMSRSICDDIIHTAGVVSTIEFFTHTCDVENDCVLIVATDGLWEFVDSQDAVDIAVACSEPSVASTNLLTEARRRYLESENASDDITACVAFLGGHRSGCSSTSSCTDNSD